MNPVQIARGIEKTAVALVSELKMMSREVNKFNILLPFCFDVKCWISRKKYSEVCETKKKMFVCVIGLKSILLNSTVIYCNAADSGS